MVNELSCLFHINWATRQDFFQCFTGKCRQMLVKLHMQNGQVSKGDKMINLNWKKRGCNSYIKGFAHRILFYIRTPFFIEIFRFHKFCFGKVVSLSGIDSDSKCSHSPKGQMITVIMFTSLFKGMQLQHSWYLKSSTKQGYFYLICSLFNQILYRVTFHKMGGIHISLQNTTMNLKLLPSLQLSVRFKTLFSK